MDGEATDRHIQHIGCEVFIFCIMPKPNQIMCIDMKKERSKRARAKQHGREKRQDQTVTMTSHLSPTPTIINLIKTSSTLTGGTRGSSTSSRRRAKREHRYPKLVTKPSYPLPYNRNASHGRCTEAVADNGTRRSRKGERSSSKDLSSCSAWRSQTSLDSLVSSYRRIQPFNRMSNRLQKCSRQVQMRRKPC